MEIETITREMAKLSLKEVSKSMRVANDLEQVTKGLSNLRLAGAWVPEAIKKGSSIDSTEGVLIPERLTANASLFRQRELNIQNESKADQDKQSGKVHQRNLLSGGLAITVVVTAMCLFLKHKHR